MGHPAVSLLDIGGLMTIKRNVHDSLEVFKYIFKLVSCSRQQML